MNPKNGVFRVEKRRFLDSSITHEQIESFIKKKVDLLIVAPNSAVPLSPLIDKAYDSGIPVICFDRKTSSNKYTAFMGADNYEIGYHHRAYRAGVSSVFG